MNALDRSYGEFSSSFHARTRGQRLPTNGTLEISHRCPLNCSHCYNNLPVGDRAALAAELSFAEMCRIIDEMAEAGCLWLLFTGGEIFARHDFLDIYTHAKKAGLLITLFTNGTMITPEIADYLLAYRPFSIEITLYGRTRETYERLTRIPGSYDRCMRGIDLLLERGLPLKLKTVAVSVNRHEIGAMQEFAESRSLEFKYDGAINARTDCSQSPLEVRLAPAEMVMLDLEDPKRKQDWERLAREYIAPLPSGADNVYQCGGGMSGFAIDPTGKLSICVLSQAESYDLKRGTFKEGWETFLLKVRQKKVTRKTKCTDCQLRMLCSMCAATAELESQDPEAPVDYFCEVAHLRALAVGVAPPAHGDCEYCAGGSGHTHLMQQLEIVKNGDPAPTPTRPRALAIVKSSSGGSSCGSGGGCGSCGTDENHATGLNSC